MSSADGVAVKATPEEPDAVCRGWWSESAGDRRSALFMLAGTAMGVSVTDPASGDLAPPEWVDLATVVHLDALGDPEAGIQTVELGLSTGTVRTAGWTGTFCDAVVDALQRLVAALAAAPPPAPVVPAPGTSLPSPAGGDPLPPAVPPAPVAPAGPGPFAPAPPSAPDLPAPVLPTADLPAPDPVPSAPPPGEQPPPFSAPPVAVPPVPSAPPFSSQPAAAPAPLPAPAPAPQQSVAPAEVPLPAATGASLVLEDVVYLGGHPSEPKKKKRCTATLTDTGVVVEGPGEMSVAVPWSTVVSVESQNSDEARFRMNLRVHRDATAVIVTQHDGTKLLLEARDCPTIPLRSAIAQLLVEQPVEVA